jgi:hypothetical protein
MKIKNIYVSDESQMIVEEVIDLDSAKKPNGKFVHFHGENYKENSPDFEYPYDVQFKNTGMNQFRCSSLECDDLKKEDRNKSLRRMIICLQKHIDQIIELELIAKRLELEEKYNKMYNISDLIKKSYNIIPLIF